VAGPQGIAGTAGLSLASNAIGIQSAQYVDNSFGANATSTVAGVANRLEMTPFSVASALTINEMGINVTTLLAAATCKLFIYTSDADGTPSVLAHEQTSTLDCSTTGYKAYTVSFTFLPNIVYWVGVRYSSTATISALALTSLRSLGLATSTGTTYLTVVRRTLAYATALPASFATVLADKASSVAPAIRMRKA
jgi:hypothetical protein